MRIADRPDRRSLQLRRVAASLLVGLIGGDAYGVARAQSCTYADLMGGWGLGAGDYVYRNDNTDYGSSERECMENAIYGPEFDGSGWNGKADVQFTPYPGSGAVDITIKESSNLGNVGALTTYSRDASGRITGGLVEVNTQITDCSALQKAIAHEVGHLFGLDDMTGSGGSTTMNQFSNWTDSLGWVAGVPTSCDAYQAWWVSSYECPSEMWFPDCPEDWESDWFGCCYSEEDPPPPFMVVQPNGNEPILQEKAVLFDRTGRGVARLTSWPSPRSLTGFLVMDHNGNGLVDSGAEILGKTFPQRQRPCDWTAQNALAQFDRPQNGGNGDGQFDSRDTEFKRLQVWFDYDGNGKVNQATHELVPLQWVGIRRFDLAYNQVKGRSLSGRSRVAGVMMAETFDGKPVPVYAVSFRGMR